MTKAVENIMALCADTVEKAGSGHIGAPLGLSQLFHILYTEYLNLNPDNPMWLGRDIFILSNGHACVLQYVMNHLIGFLPLEELKEFRQLNSKTPGHPEKNNHGIEISTGPLGQGVAASLGFAISSKILQKYGIKNKIYCVFGDGCYQEGISQEAFSLCSSLGLDNITFIYDYNEVTIDGSTAISMYENVVARFKSLNFDVLEIEDNPEQIRKVLDKQCNKTKIIIIHTKIGKGTDFEGTRNAHGNPLDEEKVLKLKEKLKLPKEKFYISEELQQVYGKAKERMRKNIQESQSIKCTGLDCILKAHYKQEKVEYWAKYVDAYAIANEATRTHFSKALNAIKTNASLLCGCADLTQSINPRIKGAIDFSSENFDIGCYIRYGIREHAMFGVMNGISAHGVFIPLGGTFLNFATYGIPAIRIACLDKLKAIYVLTHDSIGLGEDGPTHQPIEVLATLRALPNLTTFRPCDGIETREALLIALKRIDGPSVFILSRQVINELKEESSKLQNRPELIGKGGYFLVREKRHDIILLATGSEVHLAFEVKSVLKEFKVSVVSMISFELFDQQSSEYKKEICDEKVLKISIEALSTFGWAQYSDFQIGMSTFGKSAPQKDVLDHFGFTVDKIAKQIRDIYRNKSP
ncbi:Transketolase [Glugoides intestinalis]